MPVMRQTRFSPNLRIGNIEASRPEKPHYCGWYKAVESFNPGGVEAQWPVIAGAPTLILALLAIAMIVGWGLRGTLARGQMGAIEDRLKLAIERFETAAVEKAHLEKAIGRLERHIFEVNDAKDRVSLSAQSAAVQSHIRRLAELWTQIGNSLGPKG